MADIERQKELTLDELGNALADVRNALAVRVGADGAYLLLKLVCASNYVLGKGIGSKLCKGRIFHQRYDLEGDVETSEHNHSGERGVWQICVYVGQIQTCLVNVIGGWSKPFC
jgi:hypothetical protein